MTYPVDYEAAAALIPDAAFGPLCHAADKLNIDDDEPTLHSLRWCAGSRFEFIPGDDTLYDVLLVRLNENELLVSLLNGPRTTAILPFGYDNPAVSFYVAEKLKLAHHEAPITSAVCALVNRAAGAVVQLAEINRAAQAAADKIIASIVIMRPNPDDVDAATRSIVPPEGTTSDIAPETLKAMFEAEPERLDIVERDAAGDIVLDQDGAPILKPIEDD